MAPFQRRLVGVRLTGGAEGKAKNRREARGEDGPRGTTVCAHVDRPIHRTQVETVGHLGIGGEGGSAGEGIGQPSLQLLPRLAGVGRPADSPAGLRCGDTEETARRVGDDGVGNTIIRAINGNRAGVPAWEAGVARTEVHAVVLAAIDAGRCRRPRKLPPAAMARWPDHEYRG